MISALPGFEGGLFLTALVATLIAAMIRGLAGFGMAILLVPMLGLVMRPDEAVGLSILLQLMIAPLGLRAMVRDAEHSSALLIGGAAVIATPFGVWVLAHTPPDVARIAIASIAILAFVMVLLPMRAARRPRLPATLATGAAAGILTGFAAMPGPPVVTYYMRRVLPPAMSRASIFMVFLATSLAGALASTLVGLIDLRIAILAVYLFPAVVVGNWLGGLAFGKVTPALWRSIVAVILGLASAGAVFRLLQP